MEYILPEKIVWDTLPGCTAALPEKNVEVPKTVYKDRLTKLRERMEYYELDFVVIYADREHYSNFRYYAAFEPRFEEGLLVISKAGKNYVLLGNECLGLYKESVIELEAVLCQILSLPNQPMEQFGTMEEIWEHIGVMGDKRVGLAGWKLFINQEMFDVPAFIVRSLEGVLEQGQLINATGVLINPQDGFRTRNDVHTIARLEYGAAFSSQRVKNMLDILAVDKSEYELAAYLNSRGQVLSCHTYLAAGENRMRGLISPTDLRVKEGDPFCASMGLEGGLSCRAGYVAESEEDLPDGRKDYLSKLAKPYYAAVATWYQMIGIGVTGGELYDAVQSIIPKEKYGWVLNPGHLIGTEEWLSSPVYPESKVTFESGMLVQMDIIPDIDGYSSPNAEDGICIADHTLQEEIKEYYPDMWERMQIRRQYMTDILGIKLKPEILPMSNLAAEYRPFMLNKEKGFKVV